MVKLNGKQSLFSHLMYASAQSASAVFILLPLKYSGKHLQNQAQGCIH